MKLNFTCGHCHQDGEAGAVVMVNLRVKMRVNQWEREAVPLCASCRKAMRGQWKHANSPRLGSRRFYE